MHPRSIRKTLANLALGAGLAIAWAGCGDDPTASHQAPAPRPADTEQVKQPPARGSDTVGVNDTNATTRTGAPATPAAEDPQAKGAVRAIPEPVSADQTNAAKGSEANATPATTMTDRSQPAASEPQAKGADRAVADTAPGAEAMPAPAPVDGAAVDAEPKTSTAEQAKGVVGNTDDPATAERNRQEAARHAPDDTGRNARDRNADAVTPLDQSESRADLDITAEIRRTIVGKAELSALAKNIKIITRDGNVTLRGPVATSSEVVEIREIALSVPGVRMVDNDLEVAR